MIVDRDFVPWESNTICRYQAHEAGRADLPPATAKERASVEQWMDWQATSLNPAWRGAFHGLIGHDPTVDAAVAASTEGRSAQMAILEARLRDTGAFAVGDTFSLADIVLGLSVHRWFATPIARPHPPAVAAYYERLSERPGFRAHGRNGTP
jgi:glutathione S-transferase